MVTMQCNDNAIVDNLRAKWRKKTLSKETQKANKENIAKERSYKLEILSKYS